MSYLLDVLLGRADALTVEPVDPLADQVEFLVERNGEIEGHQTKRQPGNSANWTILKLDARVSWPLLSPTLTRAAATPSFRRFRVFRSRHWLMPPVVRTTIRRSRFLSQATPGIALRSVRLPANGEASRCMVDFSQDSRFEAG